MENNSLTHWGIKGMKWGVRRYQNRDGSLTAAGKKRYNTDGDGGESDSDKALRSVANKGRSDKAKAWAKQKLAESPDKVDELIRNEEKQAEEHRRRAQDAKSEKGYRSNMEKSSEHESNIRELKKLAMDETKRAELLKSTDPNELYKNRDLLTTAEIDERIKRIDTEAKLGAIAAKTKTTGRDRVDKVLGYAKMANDLYEVTQKPVVKAVAKQLGLTKETPKKISKVEEVLKNLDNASDEEVQKALNRAKNINSLKDALDPNRKKNNKNSGVTQDVIDDILRELEELKNK